MLLYYCPGPGDPFGFSLIGEPEEIMYTLLQNTLMGFRYFITVNWFLC